MTSPLDLAIPLSLTAFAHWLRSGSSQVGGKMPKWVETDESSSEQDLEETPIPSIGESVTGYPSDPGWIALANDSINYLLTHPPLFPNAQYTAEEIMAVVYYYFYLVEQGSQEVNPLNLAPYIDEMTGIHPNHVIWITETLAEYLEPGGDDETTVITADE